MNEDEIGPYWVPLGLILRLKPDGKIEATDVHDDVSMWICSSSGYSHSGSDCMI